jgi:cephalosporin hydroxylase
VNPEFEKEKKDNIRRLGESQVLRDLTHDWLTKVSVYKYSYHFKWMGRPIIQFPQDILAMQEIIWQVKPDLIIETGIAHGGSLIFYASMMELLGGNGKILGIDTDIREHNRREIEKHPMFKRIRMIQGSSVDRDVVRQVYEQARGKDRVIVALDSHHTHAHVLEELNLYSPLVKKGSYLVVFDTIIEDLPQGFFANRPWDRGNSPKTATWQFLKANDRFEPDPEIENKLLITVAPGGYLKCIKD